MKQRTILYLSRDDVQRVGLGIGEIIDVVEQGFGELGRGEVEMPPKVGVHPGDNPDNFIHAMPAYVPGAGVAGVKWVSAYPNNSGLGLPNISGLVLLNCPENGVPLAVLDCRWITAMRTAAASAVAAKYLARPDAKTLGILGCGEQARSHLQALREVFSLDRLRLYGTNRERTATLASYGRDELGLEVELVLEPRGAVTGSDIVVTAGPIHKVPHETIQAGWLDPGAFATLVDFDSYWSRPALAEVGRWVTDYMEQYRHYRDVVGYLQACPEPDADLGSLVTGRAPGRQDEKERTFVINLGVAMADMVVAMKVYELAREKQLGVRLPL